MLHNFGTPKYCICARNMIFHLIPAKFAKCSGTLPYIILGPMDLNGCFISLVPRNSAFGLEHKFCIFYVSKVSEMPWNTPKHEFRSNGLEWMLHNFGTPKYCLRARNTSFLLLPAKGLRNAQKNFQTSFWVQWTRMDASQLWYPEILHLRPKHEFFIFYLPSLRNAPEHFHTSFWVQWTWMDAS
jgi:hypothetical protein